MSGVVAVYRPRVVVAHFAAYARSAAYDPTQPRDPAGTPTGGQWTSRTPVDSDAMWVESTAEWNKFHPTGNASLYKIDGAEELGKRLRTKVNDADIARALAVYNPYRSVDPNVEKMGLEAVAHERAVMLSNAFTSTWASSSGDSDARAVLYQHAVMQEFGLDEGVVTSHLAPISDAIAQMKQGIGREPNSQADVDALFRVMRAHARAQYENTQETIASGPAEWTLIRGAVLSEADAEWISEKGTANLQPISSFTTNPGTAGSFGRSTGFGGNVGTRIRTRVPRSRIFSIPRTGFGCYGEWEVLILGGSVQVKIEGQNERGEWKYLAYNPDQPRAPEGSSTGGQWVNDGVSVDVRDGEYGTTAVFTLPDDAGALAIRLNHTDEIVEGDDTGEIVPPSGFAAIHYVKVATQGKGDGFRLYKKALAFVKERGFSGLASQQEQREPAADKFWQSLKKHGATVKTRGSWDLLIDLGPKARTLAYNPDQPRAPKGDPEGGQWVPAAGPGEFPYADDTILSGKEFDKDAGRELRESHKLFREIHEGYSAEHTDDEGAQDLKREVSQDLAAALDGEFDEEQLRTLAELLGTAGAGESPGYDLSKAYIDSWAATSGDHNAMAVLYQHAAAEELGIDAMVDHFDLEELGSGLSGGGDSAEERLSELKNIVADELGTSLESHGIDGDFVYRTMRAHARAQYGSTQAVLADGPAFLTLARGMSIDPDDAATIARTGRVALQPLSSFTSDLDTASNFAGQSSINENELDNADVDADGDTIMPASILARGHIIRTRIPRSRIFSIPRTGFGCLNEFEFVVLGNRSTPVKIGKRFGKFNKPKPAVSAKPEPPDTDDPRFTPFSERSAKYDPNQPREPRGDPEGGQWTAISDRATRGEMRPGTAADRKRLAVPPAYTDLQVTDDPDAELVATARTPKGKLASFYTDAYHDKQAAAKWARIQALQEDLPDMLKQADKDIRERTDDYDVAMTVRLIAQTGLRNGGDAGEGIGASNLRLEHVTVSGSKVRLQFKGKGGVDQDHTVDDKVFAAYVKERRSSSTDGRLFPHDAARTLDYQKQIGRGRYKVHDLRTHVGTTLASKLAQELIRKGATPTNAKELKAAHKLIAGQVSRKLGNTPAVALSTYIHPAALAPLATFLRKRAT